MLTKFVCCNRLVILSVLLHQVHAEEGRLVCTVEDKKIMKTKAFELSDAMRNKSRIMKECGQTRKLILESGSILTLEGDDIEDFVHWLFWEKELEMCVAIVNNAVMEEMPVSPKSIKRTCEGPLIRIVNNTNLYRLTLNNKLVSSLKSVPDAIRIRGNRKLRQTYLEYIEFQRKGVNGNWDLQPLGECPLPAPFTSFDTLDRNCTNYYGALMLEQGITELPYNSSEVHKFNIDGCIQIENTELKDITFLMGFSRFRRMQSCEQFIRNNKRLCSKNLNYLNVIFKDIQFSNNGDQFCSECIGGQVSKHYLEESLNCSLIYGDLIISNFRGLPSNFENLRSIETIEGRLIIINNTGLYEFDYLASLKIVGRNTGGGAAIIVKDNADLSLLALPNLLNLRLNKSDGSVELANNPMFTVDSGKSAAVSTTTPELYTSIRNNEEGKTVAEKNSEQGSVAIGESRPYSNGIAHRTIIFGGVAAALVLILMCSLASFLMCRQEINTLRLPQPPYELYAKSQEKLGSLCLEILERNPTIWSTEDFNILWKCGPHTAREIAHPSSRHAEFIKSNMIPTTNNGNVSQQKDQRCQKYRARELLRYDLVIMIGNTNNVREVVSDLPRSSGDISTYTDEKSCISIAYKLLKVREFSSKLTLYKYEAKDMNKNEVKSIEILLYQW